MDDSAMHGASSRELAARAEARRERLAASVDELSASARPQRLKNDAVQGAMQGLHSAESAAKHHPGYVAAGGAVLLGYLAYKLASGGSAHRSRSLPHTEAEARALYDSGAARDAAGTATKLGIAMLAGYILEKYLPPTAAEKEFWPEVNATLQDATRQSIRSQVKDLADRPSGPVHLMALASIAARTFASR